VRLCSVVTRDGDQESTRGREAVPLFCECDKERKDQSDSSATGLRSGGTARLLDIQTPEVCVSSNNLAQCEQTSYKIFFFALQRQLIPDTA
jgi:hypothetical protein